MDRDLTADPSSPSALIPASRRSNRRVGVRWCVILAVGEGRFRVRRDKLMRIEGIRKEKKD
jgi:hypothetical protein